MSSIKLNKSLLFFLCIIFVLFPFRGFLLNLGCNFKFKSDSNNVVNLGQCRAGLLSVYTWDKNSGGKYYNKFIMGTYSNTIYLVKVSGYAIKIPTNNETSDYIFNNVFFVGSLIKVNDRKYIVDIDYPDDSVMTFPVNIKK
ncbi:hypothetical protein DP190_21300 [Enterobacter cloacae]|uniref:hypothetical protein n=1 Tax=Enterobacter sp. 148H3 TaxID=3077756 RepID=UPI000DCD77D9|nr:hypothetical protein [Enterobacter sp. 148H3]RAY79733.1 hypothetical protein DP190_21300 [Enterobacter cloacae]